MTNEEHRNWVEARANCTLYDAYRQIVEAVKHDVECFNGLPDGKRPGKEMFSVRETQASSFYVARDRDMPDASESVSLFHGFDYVRINDTGRTVRVLRSQGQQFEVTPHWNERAGRCDLLIDGEPHSPSQISQRAIGDLLFP